MEIFETHFHFEPEWDAEIYFQEAIAAGVKYFLAAGGDELTTETAKTFAAKFENAFYSAGVHPHDSSRYVEDVSAFANFATDEKCVAIGEIGLDYYYENSDRKAQLNVFENCLQLALDTGLPAMVHCRDKEDSETAYEEAFSLLQAFSGKGGTFVVHCYTGSVAWAKKFLELGGYLGITGIVTFPRAHNVREVVRIIPNDRILVETDTPYLAPVPYRGKINHSKYLPYIVSAVARGKGKTDSEMARLTTENAFRLFKKAGK